MKNKVKNTIWQEVELTGLLLEFSDEGKFDKPVNTYCGINVSKTDKEPIDQVQFFIAAKKIQNWNYRNFGEKGSCLFFIGGLFEVLNARNVDEVQEITRINSKKELAKKNLYLKIIQAFDLNAQVLLTKDLWENEIYWNILKDLIDRQEFTRGLLMNDTMEFYNSKEELLNTIKIKELPKTLVNLPLDVLKKIGNWSAPLIYTPAEVSESLFLKRKEDVSIKIGQAQERTYDKYLYGKMATLRLKQPQALNSTRRKSIPVTPYIDKIKQKEEIRIYFDDSTQEIEKKLQNIDLSDYIYSVDQSFGQTINPIIEKLAYGVESAICQGADVEVLGMKPRSGQDVLNFLSIDEVDPDNLKKATVKVLKDYVLKLAS